MQVAAGSVASALAAYRARPDVEFAEPDYIVRARLEPNDPRFPEQWGMRKIAVPAAWDVSRSAPSVPIAIVDCGIYNESSRVVSPDGRTGHPDMRGKVTREQNFSPSPDTDDFCNHGTHVAGISAASTNNAVGVAGVGFDAALLNAKVLDDLGGGTDQSVAQGISWAADNGARVISMSLGRPGACGGTVQAAIDSAWSRGAVIVVAAGNDGYIGATAPGNCNHVLSAAATDSQDGVAPFSNYGPSIPVGAPGVGILSSNNTGDYESFSGTSMAAPHVAGLAALIWSTQFGTSNQAVVDRIVSTADQIPGSGTLVGAGRINAARAVGSAGQVQATPTPTPTFTLTPTLTPPVTLTPTPTSGQLVTFDDLSPANRALNGQYPTGVIDWGTNSWYVSGPWRASSRPTASASMAAARPAPAST